MKLLIVLIVLFNSLIFINCDLDFDVCDREGLSDQECKDHQASLMKEQIKRAIDELNSMSFEPDQVNTINLDPWYIRIIPKFSINDLDFGNLLVVGLILVVFGFVIKS